jgi:hypothetical protein
MYNIKDYYTATFPSDELGLKIRDTATFDGLLDELNWRRDIYAYIGVADSLVRERVFEQLANREGFTYDEVYNQWSMSFES